MPKAYVAKTVLVLLKRLLLSIYKYALPADSGGGLHRRYLYILPRRGGKAVPVEGEGPRCIGRELEKGGVGNRKEKLIISRILESTYLAKRACKGAGAQMAQTE